MLPNAISISIISEIVWTYNLSFKSRDFNHTFFLKMHLNHYMNVFSVHFN